MSFTRILTLALCLTCTAPLYAQQTIDPAVQADILRLIKATGADRAVLAQAETLTDELIAPVKIVRTDIPEARFAEIRQEIVAFVESELGGAENIYAELVPLYAKHYSATEIKTLADFYESPLGQKTLTVMPQIDAASKAAYEGWSQQFLPMIAVQLQQRLQ